MPANTAPPTHLTRPQWACMSDADEGKTIGRTRISWEVLDRDTTGAVLHNARVVDKLLSAGWLREIDPAHLVITETGRAAFKTVFKELPVR